jgi:hypothetical protein
MNVYIRSYFHNDTIKILVLKTIANICTLVRTLSEKSIPKDYFNFLKHENNDIDNESKSRNRLKLLNNLKLKDIRGKIINTKDIKFKIIQ